MSNIKMYICTGKCPELDWQGEVHCQVSDPMTAFVNSDGCPIGNKARWEEMDENRESLESLRNHVRKEWLNGPKFLTEQDCKTIESFIDVENNRQKGCEWCHSCTYCAKSGYAECYGDCSDRGKDGLPSFKHFRFKFKYCPDCGKRFFKTEVTDSTEGN